MSWRKSFENVLTVKKNVFSRHFFWKKKSKKNLKKFSALNKFSKLVFEFFFQKYVLKKTFFECQKIFKTLSS